MKILAVTPNPSDGTSWYRSALPLARLRETHEVQVIEYSTNPVGWHDMVNFDILFLQRPDSKQHIAMIESAASFGLKIWIDFDDLLWNVPQSSIVAHVYNKPEKIRALHQILSVNPAICSISVTTEHLKQEILAVNPMADVYVIPNALDEKTTFPKRLGHKKTGKIAWRGSDTHQMDLLAHRHEVQRVVDNFHVEFIGMHPFWLTGDYKHSRPGGLLQYFHKLRGGGWDLFFVGLEDNPFNRSKSNIAWLEAFYAGAICVAPNWEQWRMPGVITYEEGALYEAVLEASEMSGEELFTMWQEALSYILDNLTLKVTNRQRFEMLEELKSGKEKLILKTI